MVEGNETIETISQECKFFLYFVENFGQLMGDPNSITHNENQNFIILSMKKKFILLVRIIRIVLLFVKTFFI